MWAELGDFQFQTPQGTLCLCVMCGGKENRLQRKIDRRKEKTKKIMFKVTFACKSAKYLKNEHQITYVKQRSNVSLAHLPRLVHPLGLNVPARVVVAE